MLAVPLVGLGVGGGGAGCRLRSVGFLSSVCVRQLPFLQVNAKGCLLWIGIVKR